MNKYYYYRTLRKTILSFLDIFNDIKVGKYDKNGNITKTVDVPIKFAPKQKFYYWLHHNSHEKMLPMMSAEMTSVEYDSSRKTGSEERIEVSEGNNNLQYYLTPSPYNVKFELKIATEYMVEAEQIISQILPFFDPYVISTINIGELNSKWNVKYILNSLNLDQDTEFSEDERREILWTIEFTANTYFARPVGDIGLVKKIIQKVYTTEEAWNYWNNTKTESPSGVGHDAVEYFTKGWKTDDGKILHSYEVFE